MSPDAAQQLLKKESYCDTHQHFIGITDTNLNVLHSFYS